MKGFNKTKTEVFQSLPKSLLEKYQSFSNIFIKVHKQLKVKRPELSLASMSQNILEDTYGHSLCLCLNESGALTLWSLYFMDAQCKAHFMQENSYQRALDFLIQFVFMIADQYLEPEIVREIKGRQESA